MPNTISIIEAISIALPLRLLNEVLLTLSAEKQSTEL